LGVGFDSASAAVVSTTGQSAIVELHVDVSGEPDAVVAHLLLPGEPDSTFPMLARPGGGYGVTAELELADYEVVFETLGVVSRQSDPVRLSDLGVVFDSEPGSTTVPGPGTGSRDRKWLWLAVGFGAASLLALVFWALGGRDDGDDDHDEAPASPDSSSVP
jgi:hypothetical protein